MIHLALLIVCFFLVCYVVIGLADAFCGILSDLADEISSSFKKPTFPIFRIKKHGEKEVVFKERDEWPF
jgi:hypothetical protein